MKAKNKNKKYYEIIKYINYKNYNYKYISK